MARRRQSSGRERCERRPEGRPAGRQARLDRPGASPRGILPPQERSAPSPPAACGSPARGDRAARAPAPRRRGAPGRRVVSLAAPTLCSPSTSPRGCVVSNRDELGGRRCSTCSPGAAAGAGPLRLARPGPARPGHHRLLLFSNDERLVAHATLPRDHLPKRYLARVQGRRRTTARAPAPGPEARRRRRAAGEGGGPRRARGGADPDRGPLPPGQADAGGGGAAGEGAAPRGRRDHELDVPEGGYASSPTRSRPAARFEPGPPSRPSRSRRSKATPCAPRARPRVAGAGGCRADELALAVASFEA
jgi:hypothetical protein